jgi:hypothetical protein
MPPDCRFPVTIAGQTFDNPRTPRRSELNSQTVVHESRSRLNGSMAHRITVIVFNYNSMSRLDSSFFRDMDGSTRLKATPRQFINTCQRSGEVNVTTINHIPRISHRVTTSCRLHDDAMIAPLRATNARRRNGHFRAIHISVVTTDRLTAPTECG